ncbi:MAG: S8 family serine peptidase [Aquiluna sp.]|nr:S8 family serine peptidase [Aquiluna sp.]
MQLAAGIVAIAILGATLAPSDHWWLLELGDKVGQPLGGEGVVVAVIDTGVDVTHPDLASTVIGGADFSRVGTPEGTTPVGTSGYHGTMVASLIAGQGLESGGIIGIAPGAKLLSVSVGLGVESSDTDAQIAAAIIWSVDAGADVINLSLSRNSATWPVSWDNAFLYAFENDVVVVAASGNDSDGNYRPAAPATIPGVISVTGLNQNLEATGLAGTAGIDVTLGAPGAGLFGSYPGDQIAGWSGSSAATPIVSGVVALMRAKDPEASANDIVFRLINTTRDLGEPGFDEFYGFGLVDPTSAIASALTATTNPLGSLSYWVSLYRASETAEPEGSNLVTPIAPESFLGAPDTRNALQSQASQASWYLNPLLYLLITPAAPLLWLALRKWRNEGQGRKIRK